MTQLPSPSICIHGKEDNFPNSIGPGHASNGDSPAALVQVPGDVGRSAMSAKSAKIEPNCTRAGIALGVWCNTRLKFLNEPCGSRSYRISARVGEWVGAGWSTGSGHDDRVHMIACGRLARSQDLLVEPALVLRVATEDSSSQPGARPAKRRLTWSRIRVGRLWIRKNKIWDQQEITTIIWSATRLLLAVWGSVLDAARRQPPKSQ